MSRWATMLNPWTGEYVPFAEPFDCGHSTTDRNPCGELLREYFEPIFSALMWTDLKVVRLKVPPALECPVIKAANEQIRERREETRRVLRARLSSGMVGPL